MANHFPAYTPYFEGLSPLFERSSTGNVGGMIQKENYLPIVLILAACSTGGQRPDYRPKSPPEYRAEAEYIATGKITDGRLAFIDPKARIQLQPSPGDETNPGQEGFEVLNSRADSGGYFAFVQEVPVTQYFRIVRQADCETTSTITLITPALVKSSPDYYIKSKRFTVTSRITNAWAISVNTSGHLPTNALKARTVRCLIIKR
ncbi:MAG: hypothetical protein IPJ48_16775 [Propionivibrio sp.]|uniref:Uncharacterized protein n=1 Tax=Candidatus Propionivibrio dominans TaxID=2954373 RepID=A0A9D7F9G6_9RHOO|nr:hypothetical protein [Candidatus Propionivibrio dominans]